jgi:UDP-N-acetylenolpyruvoylglucosamine reductase
LNIGSNVVVEDAGTDVLVVNGNIYASKHITVTKSITATDIFCTTQHAKNTIIIAERPIRNIFFNILP